MDINSRLSLVCRLCSREYVRAINIFGTEGKTLDLQAIITKYLNVMVI